MKSPVAYYLLLIYLTVMFKPLIPLISDAFSHTFNEAEHISEVHFKYGNDHLQKSLAEASSDNDRSKTPNTVKTNTEVSLHISLQPFAYNFQQDRLRLLYYTSSPGKLPFVFISSQGPPPKS